MPGKKESKSISEDTPPKPVSWEEVLVNSEGQVTEIYTNGFTVGHGNSDVVVQLDRNGKQIATINMSFTLAKTLSQILGGVIQSIEHQAETEIKTTKQFDEAFNNPEE